MLFQYYIVFFFVCIIVNVKFKKTNELRILALKVKRF